MTKKTKEELCVCGHGKTQHDFAGTGLCESCVLSSTFNGCYPKHDFQPPTTDKPISDVELLQRLENAWHQAYWHPDSTFEPKPKNNAAKQKAPPNG